MMYMVYSHADSLPLAVTSTLETAGRLMKEFCQQHQYEENVDVMIHEIATDMIFDFYETKVIE